MKNPKFTEDCCVDCRFAMDNTIVANLSESKIICDKGYGERGKLRKACRLFVAGKYKPEIVRNATI